jgi:alpha-amylase
LCATTARALLVDLGGERVAAQVKTSALAVSLPLADEVRKAKHVTMERRGAAPRSAHRAPQLERTAPVSACYVAALFVVNETRYPRAMQPMMPPLHRRTAAFALAAIASSLVACADAASQAPSSTDVTPGAAAVAAPRTVMVHLFEWKWTDIARECETYLGPKGFAAVQVSPPAEHVRAAGNPWWERYQLASYRIESRSGTRAEFANMVARCKAVGVDIYADVIMNHMASGAGTGIAGTAYQHYAYPGIYQNQDFHHCAGDGDIHNYQDRFEVQNCELVDLADLVTGSEYVRGRLAAYLNDLISLGVAGFRVDAAKHIPAADLANILSRVPGNRYVYQEVIDLGGEPITAGEYFGSGDVTEFKHSAEIGRVFKVGNLAWLKTFGPAWGFMPSDNAIVFTDNHDNQRGHGGAGNVVTHKDGQLYNLANIFMLAWPYGYPEIMSSYAFTTADQGPPADAAGNTRGPWATGTLNCGGEWVCEHRRRQIGNMVAFHNTTQAVFSVSNWWDNGLNQIAFSRGNLGFVAINKEGGALTRTFTTGLGAGVYCDIIHGDFANGVCSGPTITVNAAGQATFTVAAMDAVAIHVNALVSGTPPPPPTQIPVAFEVNATTVLGQNVFVVGNNAALSNWSPTGGVALSSAAYPLWRATVNFPAGTALEYKYIKRDGAGAVIWESGVNRTLTVPATGTVQLHDTFRP